MASVTENTLTTDILVIGSGIAGLSIALKLAEEHKISILAKGSLTEGSTNYAQGGIAGVLDPFDSIDAHIADTQNAGAGLCDPKAVAIVASHAAESIQELIASGVPLSKDSIENEIENRPNPDFPFTLTQQGCHSHRRVINAADHTGQTVLKTLMERVQRHPTIL